MSVHVCNVSETKFEDLVEMLLDQWSQHGMDTAYPNVEWMVQDNLELVFQNAEKMEKQLLLFVTHSRDELQKDIEWMEHNYRIPSLAIDLKSARKMYPFTVGFAGNTSKGKHLTDAVKRVQLKK
ncbi:unnamed protein product [Caenorhabditis nigoni]